MEDLQAVVHHAPSSISTDTTVGDDPETIQFLRGCGLPDEFIHSLSSLSHEAREFYSCFLSYSSEDQEFAERLHTDLQGNGVRCWFAPEHLKIGDRTRQVIHDTIRLRDKLLVVLTKSSVESDWVEEEVETALRKERDDKSTVLFPIRLDDAVMETKTGWAETLCDRTIGDFRNWKEQASYQKALQRLLKALKTQGASAARGLTVSP